jgi:type IX secretion system PorP/SprF family membrane protein
MNFKLLFTIAAISLFTRSQAQDPIFTQYFLVPETMNPGFTGFMETTYAGVLHRTQWPNLALRINTQYGFFNTFSEQMNSGLGINILNQHENNTNYNFSQLNATYAYKVQLNRNWYFRPGLEIGYGTKSFAFQNLLLEDQIHIGSGYIDPSSVDPLVLNDRIHFLDFSAGLLFHTDNSWIALSAKHLNNPNIAFQAQKNVPLDTFYSINVGHEFFLADFIDVQFFPYETKMLLSANYMQQGRFNRLDFVTSLMFEKLIIGVAAVTNPARNSGNSHLLTSINAFTGWQFDGLRAGISYDFNTSKLGRTGGIYELSLSYQFDLDIKCFGCPNY